MLTQQAFTNCVFEKNKATRAMRGTVSSRARVPSFVNVLWDGKKTPQRYWKKFIKRAKD